MTRKWRIAIVEDEPLWQQGISTLLALDEQLEVAAIFGDGPSALAGLTESTYDVILMDWKLPGGMDGLQVAATLCQQNYRPTQIILITGSPKEQLPEHPYGYVSKPAIANDLLPAIRSALA